MTRETNRVIRRRLCLVVIAVAYLQGCERSDTVVATHDENSRQDMEFSRQVKNYQEQLEVSNAQLSIQEAHLSRMGHLLDRWEKQADQVDKLLQKLAVEERQSANK
jgi:type IV pilus biogenesis protein CpaD/CtpE